VEPLNGTVALSGFAKSQAEKSQAETLARNTKGVREVRNNIVVRP
jgi:osmotically-inducible protein OsmY